jgi:5S rRNA maturation endonuclease (ribonuclease M5)
VVRSFCKNNEWCKENKAKISETQTKAIFLLLDSDDSGELEQEEIIEVLIDR